MNLLNSTDVAEEMGISWINNLANYKVLKKDPFV
jgi:hypothetical protein